MAPRGRSRKNRNTRMDAAVDSMTKIYGFSEKIVKKVLKELLKEYGGHDGWFFIEQYSYKELFEAILRDQEGNDEGQDYPSKEKADTLPESGSLKDESAEEHALADAAGPSRVVTETICSEVVKKEPETDNNDAAGPSRVVTETICSEAVKKEPETDNNDAAGPSRVVTETICSEAVKKEPETDNNEDVDHLRTAERNGTGWKDIGLDQPSSQRERAEAIGVKDEKYETSFILSPPPLTPTTPLGTNVPSRPDNSPVISPSSRISSAPPGKSIPRKRHQPCYGWIESDEEEIDDFIYLTPAVEWESSGSSSEDKVIKPEPVSKWDVKQEDS